MMTGLALGLDAWLWMGAWALAIVAIVWLLVRGSDRPSQHDEALDILRSRLARGEITSDEFAQARRLIDA
jgi:uncharacterized membrane protein